MQDANELGKELVSSYESTDRDRFKGRVRLELEYSSSKAVGIAEDLGVSQSLVSKWASEESNSCMGAHWLARWTRVVGPGLLRWIALQAGYDLVPRGSAPGRLQPPIETLLRNFTNQAGEAVGDALVLGAAHPSSLGMWKKIQHLVNGIVEMLEIGARKEAV